MVKRYRAPRPKQGMDATMIYSRQEIYELEGSLFSSEVFEIISQTEIIKAPRREGDVGQGR